MQIPTRILVPIDFTPSSRAALDYAADLAARFGASLDVLYVWRPPRGESGEHPPLARFARTYFGQEMGLVLSHLEDLHLPQVHGRLEAGDPSHTILEVAAQGYDLIVVGIHCHTKGLRHLLHSSVAQRVIDHAPCPVLTVRAPDHSHDDDRTQRHLAHGVEPFSAAACVAQSIDLDLPDLPDPVNSGSN